MSIKRVPAGHPDSGQFASGGDHIKRVPAGSPDGGQFASGDAMREEAGQIDAFGEPDRIVDSPTQLMMGDYVEGGKVVSITPVRDQTWANLDMGDGTTKLVQLNNEDQYDIRIGERIDPVPDHVSLSTDQWGNAILTRPDGHTEQFGNGSSLEREERTPQEIIEDEIRNARTMNGMTLDHYVGYAQADDADGVREEFETNAYRARTLHRVMGSRAYAERVTGVADGEDPDSYINLPGRFAQGRKEQRAEFLAMTGGNTAPEGLIEVEAPLAWQTTFREGGDWTPIGPDGEDEKGFVTDVTVMHPSGHTVNLVRQVSACPTEDGYDIYARDSRRVSPAEGRWGDTEELRYDHLGSCETREEAMQYINAHAQELGYHDSDMLGYFDIED